MIDKNRRTGRTTRIIDKCIQDLFIHKYCFCIDHHKGTPEIVQNLSKNICNKIIVRLENEHNLILNKNFKISDSLPYKINLI